MTFSHKTRVPLVLQMETAECGAACLTMILAYYGKKLPLDEVRHACGVSRDGSNANSVIKAARNYGLEAKGFSYSIEQLKKAPLPAIVFWEFKHFVVVERFSEQYVYIADPALGRRRVTWEEFSGSFTGIMLTFKPGPRFARGDSRPPAFRQILAMLHGARAGLGLVWVAALMVTLIGFGIPMFTQVFVDFVLIQDQLAWETALLWGLVLMIVVHVVANYVRQHLLVNIRFKLGIALLNRFVSHLMRLPINFYSQRGTGDLMARAGLNNSVRALLSDQLITALMDMFLIAIYLVLMLAYDLLLTMIVLIAAMLNIITIVLVNRARVNQNALLLMAGAKQRSVEMGTFSLIETIKSSGSEDQVYSRWRGLAVNTTNAAQSFGRLSVPMSVVPTFVTAAVTGLVLWIGGERVITGAMSIGMVMAFQALQHSFLAPIGRMVGFAGSLQKLKGSWDRIEDVLRVEEVKAPDHPDPLGTLEGKIELRNVTFGYSPTAPPLIKDLSLIIKPGQRVVLVGPSGAGKSTIAKLIVGILQPDSGEILYDGIKITDLDLGILRKQIGIVNQASFLFKGTIRDNLSLWDERIEMSAITAAARDACIHDDIAEMAMGYDTMLAEGASNLSGGQIQRVCIARVLTHFNSILLLDEATSALDAVTEERVIKNLRKRGCTNVVIAHRLSTIRDADEILVLDHGAIKERGNHEALMKLNGVYASLIEAE